MGAEALLKLPVTASSNLTTERGGNKPSLLTASNDHLPLSKHGVCPEWPEDRESKTPKPSRRTSGNGGSIGRGH